MAERAFTLKCVYTPTCEFLFKFHEDQMLNCPQIQI